MTTFMFDSAKDLFLKGDIDLLVDTIKATLIDTDDYTVSTAHDYYDDVTAAAKEEEATLSGKTVSGGVFDADNTTFASASGDPCEALIVWKDTSTASTSPLLFYIDDFGAGSGNTTITLNGGDVIIQWSGSGILVWGD